MERFWKKVDKTENGCWRWTACRNPNGYGRLRFDGKQWLAHRFVYELLVGPIPEGLTIDHLCRVRNCVNPSHLEPVTQRENVLRGESFSAKHAVKTHCINGHEFNEENTRVEGERTRRCLTCKRESDRKYRAKKKARESQTNTKEGAAHVC